MSYKLLFYKDRRPLVVIRKKISLKQKIFIKNKRSTYWTPTYGRYFVAIIDVSLYKTHL